MMRRWDISKSNNVQRIRNDSRNLMKQYFNIVIHTLYINNPTKGLWNDIVKRFNIKEKVF